MLPPGVSAQSGLTREEIERLRQEGERLSQIRNQSNWVIETHWVDRARIEVTKFEYQFSEELPEEEKQFLRVMNTALREQNLGIYYDQDMDDTTFYYAHAVSGCDDSVIESSSNDINNNIAWFKWIRFNYNDPAISGCGGINPVYPPQGSGLEVRFGDRFYPVKSLSGFNPGDPNNRLLWFKFVDADTMQKIDGDAALFRRSSSNPSTYFNEDDGDNCERVEVRGESGTPGRLTGMYATCDATKGNIEPITILKLDAPDRDQHGDTGGFGSSEDANTCEAGFQNPLSWAICGILGFIDDGLTSLTGQVSNLLILRDSDYNNPQLREAWSYFRNIASALLVIIGLIMVIGQAVGRD